MKSLLHAKRTFSHFSGRNICPLSLLLFLIFAAFLSSCDVTAGGNLVEQIKTDISTTYTFFSDTPAEDETENTETSGEPATSSSTASALDSSKNESRTVVQEDEIIKETKTFQIGKTYSSSSFPAFTMEDYDLLGWKYLKNPLRNQNTVPSNFILDQSQHIVRFTATPQPAYIVAEWKTSGYHTISFVTGIESENDPYNLTPVSVLHGEKASSSMTELPTLTREGYNFKGWYTSSDGGKTLSESQFDLDSIIKKNTTLYAKWEIIEYTIHYELSGAEWKDDFVPKTTFTIEESVTLPDGEQITKPGWGFMGWYATDTPSEEDKPVSVIKKGTTGDVWLYAYFVEGAVNYKVEHKCQKLNEAETSVIDEYETVFTQTLNGKIGGQTTAEALDYEGFEVSSTKPLEQAVILEDGSTVVTVYYDRKTITYTFNCAENGWWEGEENNHGSKSFEGAYGTVFDSATLLSTPEKRGATFAGWKASVSSVSEIPEKFGAFDITFTPQFNDIKCTVLFEVNGHSSVSIAGSEVTFGEKVSEPDTSLTASDGYEFEGWYRSDDGGNTLYLEPYDFTSPVEENFTLYAKWTLYHTVTFKGRKNGAENTTLGSLKVEHGKKITSVPDFATKDGEYCFIHWSENSDGSGELDVYNQTVTSDLVIYSLWEIGVHITFNKNDGSGVSEEIPCLSGENYQLLNADYGIFEAVEDQEQYFWGWATDPDAAEPEYLPGEELTGLTNDTVLYALWKDASYTVTLVNSYKTSEKISGKVASGSKVALEAILETGAEFTCPNDTFELNRASLNSSSNTPEYLITDSVSIDQDKTFYCYWTKEVAFLYNYETGTGTGSGDEAFAAQSYVNGGTIFAVSGTPVRQYYDFTGWYTTSECTTEVDFTANNIPGYAMIKNPKVYAGWKAKEYAINFYTNGGHWLTGFDAPEKYTVEDQIVLPAADKCLRTGWVLDNWYDNEDFEGKSVSSIPAGSSGIKNFWAKWTPANTTYTVRHYFMKVDDETAYEEDTSKSSTPGGVTGTMTAASALSITGFVSQAFDQKEIADDGSTEIRIKYDRVQVTLSYDDNTEEEVVSVPASVTKRYGQTVNVDFGISRPNYTLTGWNTKEDGSGTWYKSGETESFAVGTEDILLYAQWQEVQGEVPSITVTLPEYSSINLSVSGTKIVVSNSSAFSNLVWYLDGENISENPVTGVTTSNMGMDINASTFKLYGVHDIYVKATEAAGGKVVTAFISLKVE